MVPDPNEKSLGCNEFANCEILVSIEADENIDYKSKLRLRQSQDFLKSAKRRNGNEKIHVCS